MEETVIVWIVEGYPSTGTLRDYAKDCENAHYSGCDVSPTVWVVNHNNTLKSVAIISNGVHTADDYAYKSISLPLPYKGEAIIKVDLRA